MKKSILLITGLLIVLLILFNFMEENSVTFMLPTREDQIIVARSFAAAIGNPRYTFDTQIKRFIFDDGTSVDWLSRSDPMPIYEIKVLKQIILFLFTFEHPIDRAKKIAEALKKENPDTRVQIITRPDVTCPEGSIILVLSDAYRFSETTGFAVLIRKNAWKTGCPRPTLFTSWPSR